MKSINNENLILARQLRQFTQKYVCEKTDISQGLLSKIENGLKDVSENDIKRLSNFYDFPESFFYASSDLSPVSHLYFRRKLTLSAKIIDSFIAKSRIIKMGLDQLFKAVELPFYDLGDYDISENTPKEIASRVRFQLKIYRGAVPNLVTLLENHGIVIFKMDFGTDKIDGLSSITNSGNKIIFLNNRMPNDRIRFSLAHELGHMVMHMEKSPNSVEIAESQANEFASEFLMPDEEILPMLYNLNTISLGDLKRRWKVSMQAIIRKAYDLNVITDKDRRNFQIYFSKKKWNKIEPIPLPIESPSLVKSTIDIYKNELNYSNEDLGEIMKIGINNFKNWFCPPKSKIIPMFSLVDRMNNN